MTADFPAAIFVPRTTENLPGISYDATKTKDVFAEDYSLPAAEVAAIEATLGVNPQGAYATVRAWLDALAAAVVTLPAVLQSAMAPTGDTTIAANYCASSIGSFEVASGHVLDVEAGGVFAVF